MALMSYAQAAVAALEDSMRADNRIVVLGEDIGRGGIFAQYAGLAQTFGCDRIIDTPISEAAIMGAGVGMALAGLRPVIELRVTDFALCAMDEIVNQAAKNRYMFGGQGTVPVVVRMPMGIWDASAAQHSQSLENWFVHLPGLVVVAPSTPQDNYSLLKAALACEDPVIFLEHKTLWATTGEVDPNQQTDIGQAQIVRQGKDLTLVTWSRQRHICLQAAEMLNQLGIDVEVIDLRSLWPWDKQTVLESCRKTGRLLVVHEAVQVGGFGAEIVSTIVEQLPCQARRLGAPRIPVGYASELEALARVSAEQIVSCAQQMLTQQPNRAIAP
jgi:acetoin:2,6-dichlorophenolindophenol oxidoreductase subunit beta